MKFLKSDIVAAVFDMDGTMFDTERLRLKMLKQASLKLTGNSMSDEVLLDSLGVNIDTACTIAKKEYGEDFPYLEVRKEADKLEVKYVREHGVPIKDGLIELLERLKKNNIIIALATSSRREIAEEYITNAGVMKYFDVTVCGDEVENGKPAPEIFTKAINKINCEPKNCIILEDSENGLKAASDAGALPIYIKDIKEARPKFKKLAYASFDSLTEFIVNDLYKVTKKYDVPKLNEHFPQNRNNQIVGIHGFGAIGGGYIAQILSHWDGYTRPGLIVGATREAHLINLVNAFSRYSVNYPDVGYEQDMRFISLINLNDEEKMIELYKKSSIIFLCLPEKAISSQASLIARGLITRYKSNNMPLTIVIIMNKLNSERFVKGHLRRALKKLVSDDVASEIMNKTYFSETVTNRMVSAISEPELIKQISLKLKMRNFRTQGLLEQEPSGSRKKYSKKYLLGMLDSVAEIRDNLSSIKIDLFNSESDMVLYCHDTSPMLRQLRQVRLTKDINTMQVIKNKLSNGTHCIIAWYSSLLGYSNIGQGMGDKSVLKLTKALMTKEIKPALLGDLPDYEEYIDAFIKRFITRCRRSFKDLCIRVGRDPLRKLSQKERVLDTIYLAQKNNVKTKYLEFGMALGLIWAIKNFNPKDNEAKFIRELYAKNNNIDDVLFFDGEYNGSKRKILSREEDADLAKRIKKIFDLYDFKKNIFTKKIV